MAGGDHGAGPDRVAPARSTGCRRPAAVPRPGGQRPRGALAVRLAPLLAPLERATSPFDEPVPAVDARGAHWCEPTLQVDITYLTRMRSGRMRQPVVRGVRDDAAVDPWEDL
ncbi:hypothetical protein [Cellulomonas sp. ATA003]|uniref:ATP dependent DNA ligase n=1 Tax=Cellulomonas sp. ATA003 TaxID=3073064 RepID=UPI002873C091|nr:hypothetical protein [Cellulomonas sp. ATA003]WNB84359.1 hypothetical protein REH70_10760 [Cellulomonas sp. ATA003]